jgi:hypothetical protein
MSALGALSSKINLLSALGAVSMPDWRVWSGEAMKADLLN